MEDESIQSVYQGYQVPGMFIEGKTRLMWSIENYYRVGSAHVSRRHVATKEGYC
jgi:hypothetical protein